MAKVVRGRLDGEHGMASMGATELYARAEELERQAGDPTSQDDPKWLMRWAHKMRILGRKKWRAVEHKCSQDHKVPFGMDIRDVP